MAHVARSKTLGLKAKWVALSVSHEQARFAHIVSGSFPKCRPPSGKIKGVEKPKGTSKRMGLSSECSASWSKCTQVLLEPSGAGLGEARGVTRMNISA